MSMLARQQKIKKKGKLSMEKKFICCLCGKEFNGWGNNAAPVANGECCDECNSNIVIPARIEEYFKNKK